MDQCCPTNTCNVMEMLPFFLDIPMEAPSVHVPPSRILSELQMPMQKRFEQLTKSTRKRRNVTEFNTFTKNPDIVVFQNFEEYQTYKTTLTFVNTKTISKNLKLHLDRKSPYFDFVLPSHDLDFAKVAPGIAYVVTIIFNPAKMRDYVAQLICETNEETIVVPIYGLGQRPLFQISDEIKLSPTAVRVTTEKSVLVHNLGVQCGHYRVSVEEPFAVVPKRSILEPSQVNELKISCTPITGENPKSNVVIICADIELRIPITCEVEEAQISLNKQSVEFFEVYVGLQDYKTLTVHNKSPFTVDFRWKMLPNEEDDLLKLKTLIANMESLAETEKMKYAKLEYNDIISRHGHKRIMNYKLREHAENLNEEFKLMYVSEAFSIIPLEGKILPNQPFDFNIIFAPSSNDIYMSSAYLDVTGRHERFHLYLSGIGRGPSIVFNVNKLNTGTIFLEAIHEYQVVVRNEGCIPATVVFQEKKTEFGGHIGCKPDFQRLKRIDSCKTFIVSFSSSIQGPFIEKVYFKIKESNEIIYFLLIGNVVCPLLKPDIDKLDFGKRAFGTEITKQVVLSNNSQVPIDFHIIMSKINYSDMIMEGKTEKKADFTYQPEKGVVGPFENVTIEVMLLTNVIDDVKETMIIKMYGSDLYKIEIPCSYTCLIPTITCEPQDIYITFCFLNFVYKRTLTFTNTTSLTGQLKYTPLEEPPNMQLSLSPTEIYITPQGVFEVELTITTDVLGLHEYPLMFTLVGQENPTRWCNLKCNGQGPVISYFPDEIHFGKVQLLIRKVRKMSFVNDSPIKAKIFLSTNDKSVIQLPLEEFELYPECEMNVDVVCFLTEDGKFDCQIFVDIENGENIVIHVSGEGIGYPIECVPNLEPVYDLGNQLTYINNKLHISISNLGRKYYKIYWSRKQVIKNPKELVDEAENPPIKSAFTFEPNYLELGENCTEEIDLIACSRMPHYVEENFYMQATIDGMGKSVINIMSVLLKVKFCVPNMSFSTTQLNFMEMHVPTEVDPLCTLDDVEIPLVSQASGEVTVKNEVEIPLDLMIRTSVGFFIKLEDDMLVESYSHILEVGKELMIHIEFKPLNESKRYIKQLGKLTVNIPEYPKTESVFLTGELCYPSVQFLPPEMNFGCLAFGSSSCKNIIIQNITFLPVKFSLELLMDTFEIVKLPSTKDGSYTSISEVTQGVLESVVKADLYKEKQSAILPVAARATVLVVKSEDGKTEERRTEEEHVTEEVETESKKDEEVFAFHPKRSSKSTQKRSQDRQKSMETQVVLEEIPEKLVEGSAEDSMRKASIKRSLNSLHKGAEDTDLSEQFLTVTSYPSQDIIPEAIDPLKIKKAAKDLLNNLMYYKHEEPDKTEIKSRDFWTEMKQNDVGPEETLRNIITLEPWEGCLKPYEYGLLSISFNPPPNISVQCTAVCKIEGGEQEPIKITGSCSNIAFSFDKTSLDVGRKLFCEVFETSITLKNDGYYEFPVKVRCDPEPIFSNKQIKPQWLNIYPQKYYLEAGKSVTFEIRYFSGLTGPFDENLIFELDFLDPITIPLKGYAVFSQVVLSIPRRDLNKRYRHVPYIGIATITDSLLLNKNVGGCAFKKSSFTSVANSYMLEDRTNAKFKQLAQEDWEVIFRDDLMPSIQELDLALERTMLNDHLAYHYEDLKRHSITKKYKIIPDFKVPPYKLDFGNVTVETPVCFTVRITNVGPEPACVKLVKNNSSSHQSNDMTIEFKQKILDVGEAAHLHVILKPTLKSALDYDDRCIRDILLLEVTHGATIPILVTATLALPRFNFTRKCVDFGMVKIGNAFRQTVLIENKGCLTCFWETEVRSLNNMKPLYHVIPSRGELLAFDKGIMNIYFVPEKKGFYNAEVVVHVIGSPKEVKLKLCGDGVQPTLVFKEPNVKFPPCIPYTTNNVKELLIQNVSTYPIEFCFTDFEDCYDEEKMLIDLFLYFHNLKTVFIPERQLGAGIPDVFINTYQMLESELRKIIKNTQSEDDTEVDCLAGYTKEQIVELICKYYTSFNIPPFPENTTDIFPLEDKEIEGLAVLDEPKQDGQSQKKGVVLIFHGGPETEYLRTAFKTSKELKVELTNVDKLIIEQLVASRSTVSMIMNNVIDEALTMYEEEPEVSEFDDEYDKLMKKIDIIMTCSPTGKKKVAQKESTIASDRAGSSKTDTRKSSMTLLNVPIKGKNKGKKGAGELFLDFSLEIFAELLKPKFERFKEAVIIESLDSKFISSPILCFECLLHAVGNMRFILVVMLMMTLDDYILYEARNIFELERESSLSSQDNDITTTPSLVVVDEPEDEKKSKKSDKTTKSTKSDKEDKLLTKEEKFEAIRKRYAKEIPKETEKMFKEFASFLVDINDICEAWDRKHCVLARAAASHTKLPDKKALPPKKRPLSSLFRFTSSVIEVDMTHIGVPLTVIEGATPGHGSALFESVINGFWMNNELKEALAELTCSAEIAIEETSCMYSVQKGTTRYSKCLSYVFKIAQGEEKSPEAAENPPLSASPSTEKTQKGGKGKKKRKASSIKSDHISIAANICKAYSGRFSPRSIINPGEIMKYELSFYPQCFGEFNHKYRIEIVGNRQCLFVKCTAGCELPKLDFTPEIVFPNCVDNFLAKKIDDKLVYLKEERILDFGTILVAGPKTPPYTTTMTLKNISKILCETSVFMDEDSDFLIEPAYFEIPVNKKAELIVSLPGRKKGKIESGLFVAIKNNPRIYRLHLRAQVSPLEFNIAPKYINFDFVPIDYSAKQYIRLTNSTLVDLKWRFVKCEWAPRIYKISKYRGSIKMNSFDKIEIEFKPAKEEIYPQRSIDLQIFDPLCSEDIPFLVENIFLQAESVEYVVDYTDNVDLGEIKGKVEYKFPLKLFNKGKTNVHLIFEKVTDSSPDHAYKKIRRIFSFNFTSEILQPQRHSAIVVRFSPFEEMEFQEVPIFICKFFDPNKPQNIIKSFQIKYSAVVLLSKFSICPSSGVHFGALELQNSRTQIINLKNTGKCQFSFIISNSETEVVDVRASRTSRNKATPSSMACLELTGYVIAPAYGDLEAGDSVDITVTFKPTQLGIYKETVNLTVSEPIKELVPGKEITLYGEATEPWIDFQSYNKMFKEHYIVNNVEDLITPPDIGTHTYFVVSKKTLHFEYVCVKRECPAKIYLQNLGQLVCVVTTKIVNSNVFTVSPTQLTIDPYNTQILTVTFKPDSINVFEGKLEISTNATTNNFFEIMLHGKSYVPQIKLYELPPPEESDNFYRIFFRPTYINEMRLQNVGIKNVGVLACRVVVNVTDSGSSMFYVIQSDTLPELNPHLGVKENNLVASSMKISLKPSEITNIYLVFKPHTICMVDTKINIYTVDNPYETNKIHVYGHCYGGDIYIGKLLAFNPKGMQSKSSDVAYTLDFGHTPLKYHQKKKFTVTNNSTKDIYRFELKHYVDTVKFIPKVGHLKPKASKEILAINTSSMPYSVSQELVSFKYTPISFLEEQQVQISWDERQQLLSWLENGLGLEADDPYIQQYFRDCVTRATNEFIRSEDCDSSEVTDKLKVTLEREEPEVIFNSDEYETIPIYMSFTADYAFYYSPITEITFSNTFIKEKSEFAFEVKNSGRVPLNIAWRITYDEVIPKYPSVEIVNDQEHEDQAAGSSNSSLCFTAQHTCDLDTHLMHPNLLKIVPQKISIPPYETGQFRVFFSPLVACLYAARLLSDIESVHPDLKNMEISVTASSVVPDYYVELEESDYLKRRTVTKVLRYIDENSKILEICAIGIGVTAVKRFSVLNTSNSALSFKMEPVVPPTGLSYINCKTPTGVILRGKKYELVFTFSTHELGDFEEEYCFSIENPSEDFDNVENDEKASETRFLIVGICRNPRVYFTVAHLGLAPTILRIPIQETVFLRNDEDEELGFKIIKESLYSYDHLQKLKIIPNSGTIMPKTEITMQLIYNAEVIGDSTFSIQCVVDTMTTPLNLNVSTKCMEVECKIQYIDQTGEEITLNPNSENIIDLGKIGIKSKTNLTFVFTNTGKTGFFYTWHYNKSHIEHLINITPKKDKEFISSGSSVKREVAFETFKKYLLKNFPMKIEISYGPIYHIKFQVAAEFPLCKFSFTNYNFENCLVQPYFAKYYSVSLSVKNFEIHPVKLTSLFEDNENITVEFKSDLIHPKCETIIPIYFHPRKEGYYEFMIPMVLNCTKRFVKIIGTGVKLNIQLMRSTDKFIDMGEVKIGDTKKYGFHIINRTPSRLEVTLFVSQDSSAFEKGDDGKLKPEMVVPCLLPRGSMKDVSGIKKGSSSVVCKYTQDANRKKVMLEEEPSTSSAQKTPNFYIEPRNPVKMDFNKKYEFLLEFRPNERLEDVTEKVFYQVQDYVIPLCSVKATCLVPEFSLDKKILTFSNVLVNMPRVKYVLLRNTGDILIKFKWVCEISKNFKVHPVEGQVNPKCDVKIDFTFSIAEVVCQLVKKCKCVINNIHSLELTLVANSISKPPPVASITFSCPVRQSVTETVNIANRTKTLWHLNPAVSNKNFDIPAEIVIEPESTSAVPVTYYPKQVINEEATLILSLPDEEILYEFIGMPLPPLPEKKLAIEIKSKQNHCEILPVYNWTDFKQCFEVESCLISKASPKTLFKTFGLDLVDLLPGELKNYRWNIYSINEEPLEFQVIFKDKQSNEYMYYDIAIKVQPPDPEEIVKMYAAVREPAKTKIKLKNPINIPVEYIITCPHPELHFKNSVVMLPYTTHDLEVTYLPVKSGDFFTTLEAKCSELGTFSYSFVLSAEKPANEKPLKFVVDIGSKGYATAEIKNTFPTNLDISAKLDNPEFAVEKYSKTILPNETASFSISFEPSALGVIESKLVINSVVSGPYVFPLYGECVPPMPKGPFFVKPGGSTSIPFFNPFNYAQVFSYSVDSKKFDLKTAAEEIKPRKTSKITVTCPLNKDKSSEDFGCPITGRLIVTDNGTLKWTFYLQAQSDRLSNQ